MQDADLFMGLAGIAGVFVGFGALIAVRSGGTSDAFETTYMRFVVWLGMLTVVAALVPLTLSPYGLGEHEVWVLSCAILVVVYLGMGIVNVRMPESRVVDDASSRTRRIVDQGVSALLGIPFGIAVILIVLGLRPDLDAALYRTVVVLILLGAGATLLELVYSQRRPQTASDPAAPPAAGGSSG
jgi:archaellum biogenesis protein FlaJ (TadC family)